MSLSPWSLCSYPRSTREAGSRCRILTLRLLAFAITLAACTDDGRNLPDVSHIDIELDVKRFDIDLQAAAADSTRNGATTLRKVYPIFFDSVWLPLMLPGEYERYDSSLVRAFSEQASLQAILDTVVQTFPMRVPASVGKESAPNQERKPDESSDRDWAAELEEAFRYARYYMPEIRIPQVVTYVSELSLGGLTYGDELLGIGLDFYLGAGYRGYNYEIFPAYVQRQMNPAHIAPRAIEAWVTNQLPLTRGEPRMLDRMVANGKVLYVKTRLLPHVADTAVLGFSAAQLDWLRDNEAQMWTHYLDEKLLYETSGRRIDKHIGVSPNVPGMPPEAPGGGANWVGLQIVEAFMERQPLTSMSDLLSLDDAQALLTASKYRPER